MEDLQKNLEEEQIIVGEKKAKTQARGRGRMPAGLAGLPGQGAAMLFRNRRLSPPLMLAPLPPTTPGQELIDSIGQEKGRVDEEVEKGREDEEAAAALQKEVTAFQEECATDLAAAEPIIQVCITAQLPGAWGCQASPMLPHVCRQAPACDSLPIGAQEAEAALNSLDKASLGELKSFGSPAAEIVQVVAACMILCASSGVIPKDLR